LAIQTSDSLKCGYVGSEHILAGIIKEGKSIGAELLSDLEYNPGWFEGLQPEPQSHKTRVPQYKFSVFLFFTHEAVSIILESEHEAAIFHNEYVEPEHILLAIIDRKENRALKILQKENVNTEDLKKQLISRLTEGESKQDLAPGFSPKSRKILGSAFIASSEFHYDKVDSVHLLLGIIEDGDNVGAEILSNLNIDREKIRAAIRELDTRQQEPESNKDS